MELKQNMKYTRLISLPPFKTSNNRLIYESLLGFNWWLLQGPPGPTGPAGPPGADGTKVRM